MKARFEGTQELYVALADELATQVLCQAAYLEVRQCIRNRSAMETADCSGAKEYVEMRMTRTVAAALLARQRDEAVVAANSWQSACTQRDRVIGEQRKEIEKLKRELKASLRFDQLHVKVQARCRKLFDNEHYDEAIAAAMKLVEVEIRQLTVPGEGTLTAVQLVSKVMTGDNAQIAFSGTTSLQEAVHHLFRGAFGVFRNPVNHEFLDIDDPAIAFEVLGFASRLLRLLDGAQIQQ